MGSPPALRCSTVRAGRWRRLSWPRAPRTGGLSSPWVCAAALARPRPTPATMTIRTRTTSTSPRRFSTSMLRRTWAARTPPSLRMRLRASRGLMASRSHSSPGPTSTGRRSPRLRRAMARPPRSTAMAWRTCTRRSGPSWTSSTTATFAPHSPSTRNSSWSSSSAWWTRATSTAPSTRGSTAWGARSTRSTLTCSRATSAPSTRRSATSARRITSSSSSPTTSPRSRSSSRTIPTLCARATAATRCWGGCRTA
mmetsp:Transcript_24211/g.76163  ORF Transcript_24211/g.76163 Transcript_24211/m.76163 type:complete len:253 (+) Transcript_24211:178-936(+)